MKHGDREQRLVDVLEIELFHLAEDFAETTDLTDPYPKKAEQMRQMREAWYASVKQD